MELLNVNVMMIYYDNMMSIIMIEYGNPTDLLYESAKPTTKNAAKSTAWTGHPDTYLYTK